MSKVAKIVRCAIYTRKSTDDGLEQEYNSLDAQYDACTAYALSQRHEGWIVVADRYDDGGFSGGNTERPGLKQLLADVAAGKIDIILLYKIDRLTRSLADFARIVDVLDKAGASFVSITQSFNTTTSMGRLTLNMLLSFAQFEREVTGERIRDKIAASKRKGIWMGGTVPLGYDVMDRRLVVNEKEAKLVRHIMERYIALNSVAELVDELAQGGYRTKVQQGASGPHRGGCPFRRGTIYHLLTNRIYRGLIVHKGEAFAGEHEPIVSDELWAEVQNAIANRSSDGAKGKKEHLSLLVGKLYDGFDRPMTPSHAQKRKHRYRYYVTRQDACRGETAWRTNAVDIENLVCAEIGKLLSNQPRLHDMIEANKRTPDNLQRVFAKADMTAALMRSGSRGEKFDFLQAVLKRVTLRDHSINVELATDSLLAGFGVEGTSPDTINFTCAVAKVRKGHQLRLIIPPDVEQETETPLVPNQKLVALLAKAQSVREALLAQPDKPISTLAKETGQCRTHMAKLLQLSFLAPDIVTNIVRGNQPSDLTKTRLLDIDLPISWGEQREILGFGSLKTR